MAKHRRSAKRDPRAYKPLDIDRLTNYTHTEIVDNGMEFKVHFIRSAAKQYLCPGCNGIISVGEPHVVAWSEESWFGAKAGQEARRHWHTSCWKSRGHLATGF